MPGDETLLIDWLNALIYEVAMPDMLFSPFEIHIQNGNLEGKHGEEKKNISWLRS
jgi:hypothetical protein